MAELHANGARLVSINIVAGVAWYLSTPVTGSLLGFSVPEPRGGTAAAEVVASAEEARRALMAAALCLAASRTAKWSFKTPAAGTATAARHASKDLLQAPSTDYSWSEEEDVSMTCEIMNLCRPT